MIQMVIAIDGPVGSGKSTVARELAKRLGFVHLNSGAFYRAVGVHALRQSVRLDDAQALANIAMRLEFTFKIDADGRTQLLVNGEDLCSELFTADAGVTASKIAGFPELRREIVLAAQRVAKDFPIVIEGRDAGTVIFPEAPHKFYLDAPLEVRAARRLGELVAKGTAVEGDLPRLMKEIADRDHRDMSREFAPLQGAKGAVVVDTSGLGVEDVVRRLADYVGSVDSD